MGSGQQRKVFLVVVDDAIFFTSGYGLENVIQVKNNAEVFDPMRPGWVYRLSLPGNRPGVKTEVWSNLALEQRRSESLGIGQVVWKFPHEFHRVAKTEPHTTITAEIFSMVWAMHEFSPMEIDELLKGMAVGGRD